MLTSHDAQKVSSRSVNMAAAEYFGKANEEFVEENYDKAIELYTRAIDEDSSKEEYYAARSHAHLKLDHYPDVVTDSDSALKMNPSNMLAFLRKGIALFHLNDFESAHEMFQASQNLASSKSERDLDTWMQRCDDKLKTKRQQTAGDGGSTTGSSGPDAESSTSDKVSTSPSRSQQSPAASSSSSSSAAAAEPVPMASPAAGDSATSQPPPVTAPVPMPTGPKTRYDWYQTETHVIVNVLIKNVKKESCTIDIQRHTLSCTVKMPTGSDYSLELELAHEVMPDQCQSKLLTSKIEIKMKKSEGIRWNKLEGDGTTELKQFKQAAAAEAGADTAVNKYPSSSHYTRDWDKVVADIKAEEKDEKPEGDAALNSLFQQIYKDGSDEVQRAMNKSFVESAGTVLSTNWKDVGDKTVDRKPPDSMEFKKYEM